MGGWIPMSADGWPVTLERLRRLDEGLTREEAEADLRWLVDQRALELRQRGNTTPTADELFAGVPGRTKLMRRWGWNDDPTKKILADRASWWDENRWGPAPSSSRATRAPDSHQTRTRLAPDSHQTRTSHDKGEAAFSSENHQTRTRLAPDPHQTRTRLAPDHLELGRVEADKITPPPSPSPSPSPSTKESVVSLRVVEGGQEAEEPAPAEPEVPKAPAWARVKGASPSQMADAVLRVLTEIRGKPANADRCATDAAHVVKLWKALGQPPVSDFADELVLVARWARESCDPLAENDIRGRRPDGSTWGADRSRSVSTLCVHSRWGDRLSAAQREQEEGGASGPYVRGDHPGAEAQGRRLTPEERKAWTWD